MVKYKVDKLTESPNFVLVAAGLIMALAVTGCEQWDSSGRISRPTPDNFPTRTLPRSNPKQSPPAIKQVLYVDSQQGTDSENAGLTTANPFKTITYALQQARPLATIHLAPGQYTVEQGETFPLKLKPGMILQGNKSPRGEGVVIIGGGLYLSRTWAGQNVTILAAQDAQILGLTITNPNTRGSGVWVESTNPIIRNNTFINSDREGVFVSGKGNPLIENNRFANNQGNGISVTREATGEIRGNIIEQTGHGLAIGGNSSPLVVNNQIRDNIDGVVIEGSARPVLRDNQIINNSRDGLVAISQSQPDLGTTSTPGNNLFEGNERYDIYNVTGKKLLVIGNQLKGDGVAALLEAQPSSPEFPVDFDVN